MSDIHRWIHDLPNNSWLKAIVLPNLIWVLNMVVRCHDWCPTNKSNTQPRPKASCIWVKISSRGHHYCVWAKRQVRCHVNPVICHFWSPRSNERCISCDNDENESCSNRSSTLVHTRESQLTCEAINVPRYSCCWTRLRTTIVELRPNNTMTHIIKRSAQSYQSPKCSLTHRMVTSSHRVPARTDAKRSHPDRRRWPAWASTWPVHLVALPHSNSLWSARWDKRARSDWVYNIIK